MQQIILCSINKDEVNHKSTISLKKNNIFALSFRHTLLLMCEREANVTKFLFPATSINKKKQKKAVK